MGWIKAFFKSNFIFSHVHVVIDLVEEIFAKTIKWSAHLRPDYWLLD